MLEKTKDIILLTLCSFNCSFDHAWPSIIPYMQSYYHFNNKKLDVKIIYSTYLIVTLGMPFGTIASSYLI